MAYDFTWFKQILEKWNITLSEQQEHQFGTYYEMLIEKNKVMNLTAVTEFDEVVKKHFLDSISLGQFEALDEKKTMLDLGTGAGFPGIPLKIIYPDLTITLADSLNKRILFLEEVISELGLTGITAVHARAEELAKDCEYCIPFVKEGGKFISYKSGEIEEESAAAKHAVFLLGGELKEIHKFEIPQTDLHRSFVVIEKVKKTPKAYPRKAGTPSKMPLK